MQLEVGMYVRTKKGIIDKILYVELAEERRKQYPNHPSKSYWRDKIVLSKERYWKTTQDIIKTSYNIIDLIEVGDYVNGKEVLDINIIHKELHINTENNILCFIKERDIKSIVTKEQFESMEYKIGE